MDAFGNIGYSDVAQARGMSQRAYAYPVTSIGRVLTNVYRKV
jgi:hypothetical protein